MKFLVVAAVLAVCGADRLDNKYLPPRGNAGAGYGPGFGVAPGGFGQKQGSFGQSQGSFGQNQGSFGQGGFGQGGNQGSYGQGGNVGTQNSGNAYNSAPNYRQSADAGAQILRQNSEVTAEGFSYDFETSNGIRADASGVATNGVQSQGSFGYKGDDGQDYSITYTADENGYRPQGAHLPTPPPIPAEILKSLEQNARDEAAGIVDDGSYHGEGAGSGGYSSSGANGYSAPSSNYGAPSNFGGPSNFGKPSNFGAASNFGKPSNFGKQSFGGATSRQYLTPNAGRPSGSGNFNPQSGYKY